MDAEEKRLSLRQKVRDAMISARLYGGAGIFIGIKNERDPSLPLDPKRVKRGGIEFLTVLPASVLRVVALGDDPSMPDYGQPTMFEANSATGGQFLIHPSRVACFYGNRSPSGAMQSPTSFGWGDSVLQSCYSACKNADETLSNIASLVYEAKIDVLGVPNLSEIMADPNAQSLFIERAQLSAMLKGNNGMMLRDADETYDSKSFTFSNLDTIAQLFLQVSSGAADIPATRLLGQSPSGMSSTGESDTRNYYDRIQTEQELSLSPALALLDECLIISALGNRPESVWYVWSSLWQTTDKERAEIGKIVAETVKTIADTNLIPQDILTTAAENTLIEYAVLNGLEAARKLYEGGADDDDAI